MSARTIDVIRATPPELAKCRAPECQRAIEWVVTKKNNRRMPVDAPLVVAYSTTTLDGHEIVSIDASTSHFATCPASSRFSRRVYR